MYAPQHHATLPDIQSRADDRGLAIDQVGIKSLRYPITLNTPSGPLSTVATFSMTVGLPASAKGTHMSRFVDVLESFSDALDAAGFEALVRTMIERLGAESGAIRMAFPCFVQKTAPVSGQKSLVDYDAEWHGDIDHDGVYRFHMCVSVPVTSLCPCSKEISDYGAHNQRSLITVSAQVGQGMQLEDLVNIAQRGASCEVYGLLKRSDEKYVTEHAYDNPKFVEDVVRDVALALKAEPRVHGWRVQAENFESIHNHSAFACISGN